MKMTEMKEVAEKIIQEGYEAGKEEDDIKMEMFSAKIPFSKLNSLFRSIAISAGLMVDPKVVTESVNAQVTESDWAACETWEHVEAFVQGIMDEVDGATHSRVLSLAKKFCKEEEIELPKAQKAPKATRARGGKVVHAVVDLFNEVQKPTKEDLYNAILPHVKGHDNAAYYTGQYFAMAYALGNSMSLADAIAETKEMIVPVQEVEVEEA